MDARHRQYEALRAYFIDGDQSAEVAKRFGYTPGSFRVLCCRFRQNPNRSFFLSEEQTASRQTRTDPVRKKIVAMRKENLSIYDISAALTREGMKRGPAMVAVVLKEEGFARLPRRGDEERPHATRPTVADVADVRQLDLSPRRFRTRFGGLFLFLPFLAPMRLDRLVAQAQFPGSKMIPAEHAIRSLLALKLFGNARHTHLMSHVLDEGLGLFSGLNVIPKRSFLTEYSCRIDPQCYPTFMDGWFDAASKVGLKRGVSFDLDFHTIPFHGQDALMQKHYVSKRSRRQKGLLAFLAQDADTRVFCYGNAQVRKETQNDEILRFVDFWKQHTGRLPKELVFDSKLTIYKNLDRLNQMGINFITLRRRPRNIMDKLHKTPLSRWRRIELHNVARAYRTPRILDEKITLRDYTGSIRQLTITDLGHEEPTLLLTNQLRAALPGLVGRYAQRMVIENSIADGIDFFHMDALSSAVAMKVDCDLQLTLMASSLYRLFGARVGLQYEHAKSRRIFRDFIDASAQVTIDEKSICVRFQKRAHNPLLLAAGFDKTNLRIPWLGGKRLQIILG